jgi:hypothetical protein
MSLILSSNLLANGEVVGESAMEDGDEHAQKKQRISERTTKKKIEGKDSGNVSAQENGCRNSDGDKGNENEDHSHENNSSKKQVPNTTNTNNNTKHDTTQLKAHITTKSPRQSHSKGNSVCYHWGWGSV